MRKGVMWTGAIVGALLAAGGWIFEFALSKGAAFIYAVVVSLVANVVFDYVREPQAPPRGTSATAPIRPAGEAHRTGADTPKAPASPAAARPQPPAIISPVPVHLLTPPPAAQPAPAAKPSPSPAPLPPEAQPPQQTALAVSPPAPAAPRATPWLAPPGPAAPPAPVADPRPAPVADPPPAPAPGPGSGGLY